MLFDSLKKKLKWLDGANRRWLHELLNHDIVLLIYKYIMPLAFIQKFYTIRSFLKKNVI